MFISIFDNLYLYGVLQGDTLAPFLFIIAPGYALCISLDKINSNGITIHPRSSSRNPSKHLTDLDFANDIALLAYSLGNTQNILLSLQQAAALVGLHINKDKTEYISTSSDETLGDASL